jgi:hypothetical protein
MSAQVRKDQFASQVRQLLDDRLGQRRKHTRGLRRSAQARDRSSGLASPLVACRSSFRVAPGAAGTDAGGVFKADTQALNAEGRRGTLRLLFLRRFTFQTFRVTPAMEAGLADHVWAVVPLAASLVSQRPSWCVPNGFASRRKPSKRRWRTIG